MGRAPNPSPRPTETLPASPPETHTAIPLGRWPCPHAPAQPRIRVRIDQRREKLGARSERCVFQPLPPIGRGALFVLLIIVSAEQAQCLHRIELVLVGVAAVFARFRAFGAGYPDRLPRPLGAGDSRQLVKPGADLVSDASPC